MLDLVGYIDAGTGSYLLAAVASGAAGIWFFVRSNFAKLRGRRLEDVEAAEAIAADETAEAGADPVPKAESAATDA